LELKAVDLIAERTRAAGPHTPRPPAPSDARHLPGTIRPDYLSRTTLWWSLHEAAKYLGVNYSTVKLLKRQGRLPCRTPALPCRYVVDRVAVERLLNLRSGKGDA